MLQCSIPGLEIEYRNASALSPQQSQSSLFLSPSLSLIVQDTHKKERYMKKYSNIISRGKGWKTIKRGSFVLCHGHQTNGQVKKKYTKTVLWLPREGSGSKAKRGQVEKYELCSFIWSR